MVGGSGRPRAVLLPGALPLGDAAGVGIGLGGRVQEVHEPHRDLHVGAPVPVHGVRTPAVVETVSQIADAEVVLSKDDVAGEEELGIPRVQPDGQLLVEFLQVLHKLLSGLHLGLIVPGDVGTV